MKTIGFLAAVGASVALATAASASIIIDFDDLVGQGPVPPGYGGVSDWGGWWYYDWAQPPYNPNSPPVRVYNVTDGMFTFADDVIFEGAYFAGYGVADGYQPISFNLYLGGNLVHTSGSLDLMSDGVPRWLASGYGGLIDTVKVNGTYGFFVMDDVTYIPAPGTLALLGLAGLGLRRRR